MTPDTIRRFGFVIGLRDECIAQYRSLHEGPCVRDLLVAAGIRNFSIFLQRLPDGRHYEFAYYEYVGADYAADMARLAAELRNRAWLDICDPMQVPLPGSASWTEMERIFFEP
jgi:L-rhamnose mutarotase